MRIAFTVILVLHALIHLTGVVKAFDLAPLAQLVTPISRAMGVVWLVAAVVLLASAVVLFAAPRWFWIASGIGLVVSQVAITTSFSDAKYGTIANVVVLCAVVYGAAAWGPFGLAAEYRVRVARRLAALPKTELVTDAELASLPAPVARYLRYVGVVGQPHVSAFRARFTGRIRSGPEAPWMDFTGEQHNIMSPRTRDFWMQATFRGLPVDGLHSYGEDGATMRVKLLSLFPVARAQGPEFTRTETVTLLNDMCIMAPATLLTDAIRWRDLDAGAVEATFTHGPHTVTAVLLFDEAGALVNFWSDDRPALAPDGVTFLKQRWSTPVGDYRPHGPVRLASRGEGRYAAPAGEYAYIEFDSLEVTYDLDSE